jgi:hypothetical protein
MTDVKRLEKLEKEQEKTVRLRKAYTEKAKAKRDLKSIDFNCCNLSNLGQNRFPLFST